jgi:uncharacterized protein
MSGHVLETYIRQHISASPEETVRFSWHGGEPTLLGLEGFRRIVAVQKACCPAGRSIANGLQTNGTLIDEDWGRFLADEGFSVGLSLDGPREHHDRMRTGGDGAGSFDAAMRGYDILRRFGVLTDVLCVVGAWNAGDPAAVYRFFLDIGAPFLSFLPLVKRRPDLPDGAGPDSVPPGAWGDFLCTVFDLWTAGGIGRIKVQIFEEALRTAFGQNHSLCIFRPVCGDIPVVEKNGDVFSCDHFVDAEHRLGNIRETPLADLLDSPRQKAFGSAKRDDLPRICATCEVLDMCHGECPKNRFLKSPDGEDGWNYLCRGYKRFFNHSRPFVAQVAEVWRRRNLL